MGIYGPRTVYCIALKDCPGCHEFLLQDDGKWLHVKETTEIGAHPKIACWLATVLQNGSMSQRPLCARVHAGPLKKHLPAHMRISREQVLRQPEHMLSW